MKRRTWVILGATSIIAEEFARLAAESGHDLILVGRHKQQLEVIAADIHLRYHVHCEVIITDLAQSPTELWNNLEHHQNLDLCIAHSFMSNNDALDTNNISQLLNVNVINTIQIIHLYWHKKQSEHHLLFLSSVAACKGRAKNSLYGASKASVEVYLQGLQQASSSSQHITIARLGFIDTHATYGEPGIFYASPPKSCATACWQALKAKKRTIYHPKFWQYIMGIITHLPFFVYKKMAKI